MSWRNGPAPSQPLRCQGNGARLESEGFNWGLKLGSGLVAVGVLVLAGDVCVGVSVDLCCFMLFYVLELLFNLCFFSLGS